jgi:hypothetical protein
LSEKGFPNEPIDVPGNPEAPRVLELAHGQSQSLPVVGIGVSVEETQFLESVLSHLDLTASVACHQGALEFKRQGGPSRLRGFGGGFWVWLLW